MGGNIDSRYRVIAAHITAMRFMTPGADWGRLLKLLEDNRATDFGKTRVETLELNFGDFYGAADSVQTLEKYPLV